MNVVEKLRALHSATTPGPWFEGNERGTLFRPGARELLGINAVRGYGQWGVFVNERDAAFVAFVHEAVLPLCDRVERAEAAVERLRAEVERLTGELDAKDCSHCRLECGGMFEWCDTCGGTGVAP